VKRTKLQIIYYQILILQYLVNKFITIIKVLIVVEKGHFLIKDASGDRVDFHGQPYRLPDEIENRTYRKRICKRIVAFPGVEAMPYQYRRKGRYRQDGPIADVSDKKDRRITQYAIPYLQQVAGISHHGIGQFLAKQKR
jgi:hypothetical protein